MENIHWKAFLEFETQNELFSCKNKEEIFFWDILRLDIYIRYMWSRAKTIAARESMGSRVRRYLYWAKSIIKLIFWLFQQKPDLFFLTSRDKSPSKKFHDKNAIDVLQLLKDRAFLLETYYFNGIEYEYDVPSSAFCFNPILIFRQVYHLFFYKKADYSDLTAKIKAGLDIDYTDAEINLAVSNFKADYAFYKFLLKKKGTKRVFLTQNGVQKGLIAAAHALGITVHEFQHGIIDKGHLLYHYPAFIKSDSNIIIPDYFLTFSDFWTKDLNFPVKKIVPVGNNAFAKASLAADAPATDNALTIVSADYFGQRLATLIEEFSKEQPDVKLFFKLHPNQFSEKSGFQHHFREMNNIEVISSEYTIPELLMKSKGVLLIQSTAAYEALQAGRAVYVLAESTYYRQEHLFGYKNVHLISNVTDLKKEWQKPLQEEKIVFFNQFNSRLFLDTVS